MAGGAWGTGTWDSAQWDSLPITGNAATGGVGSLGLSDTASTTGVSATGSVGSAAASLTLAHLTAPDSGIYTSPSRVFKRKAKLVQKATAKLSQLPVRRPKAMSAQLGAQLRLQSAVLAAQDKSERSRLSSRSSSLMTRTTATARKSDLPRKSKIKSAENDN